MTAGTAYGFVVVVRAGSVATVAVGPTAPLSAEDLVQATDAVRARAANTAGRVDRLNTGAMYISVFHSHARDEHMFATLVLWGGRTLRCRGRSWSAGCPGGPTTPTGA